MEQPRVKLIIDGERLRDLIESKGFRNIEAVVEKAKANGTPISLSTIHSILRGANWQKESLQNLASILQVDLGEFLTFQTDAQSQHSA